MSSSAGTISNIGNADPGVTGVRADAEYDRIRRGFGFGGRAGIDECNKYLHRTLKLSARRYSPN
jgi:hypothetical protein